jgi:cell division protein FtsI (penicillin-binding protein 3)
MGHEIGVTALQVLSMIDTIAYNGVQMKPMLIKKIIRPDGTVLQEFQPEELGRPLRPEVARRMRKLLVRVTEDDGTAPKARVEGYSVGGKTGTAQKIRPRSEGGGYYSKNFIASFVGFLPAENPQIGIIDVADDPGLFNERGRKIKYFGGTVCAPAFQKIAEFAVRYLRIPPDVSRVYIARPDQ